MQALLITYRSDIAYATIEIKFACVGYQPVRVVPSCGGNQLTSVVTSLEQERECYINSYGVIFTLLWRYRELKFVAVGVVYVDGVYVLAATVSCIKTYRWA